MDQPSVFVSYAWKPENERKVVDSLEKAFRANGIQLHRDIHLKFKDSIKAFMDALARGDCIVVVLSKPYLESKNCMRELLKIHENGEFRKRVFPIVLQGTRIYDAEDRIPYLEFWDEKIAGLKSQMYGLDPTHTKSIREALDLYVDIRRSIDQLMDVLGDMNALTEDVHVDTNIDALIKKVLERFEILAEDDSERDDREAFRQKIRSKLNAELDRPVCKTLKDALKNECGGTDNPVGALESCSDNESQGIEEAIDRLHHATAEALQDLKYRSSKDYDLVWASAQTMLGWLVLLSVNEHWLDSSKKLLRSRGTDIRIDIPAKANSTIEIVLSRSKEVQARFRRNPKGFAALGDHALDPIIPEYGLSSGSGWDEVKKTIWGYLRKQTRITPLSDSETEELNAFFKTNSRREGDYYFTIGSADRSHPLNNREIQDRMSRELPSLRLIVISNEGEAPVLLASEVELGVLISRFLEIGQNDVEK